MKKILYIHHTSFFRGSATSLSYLLKELDRSLYEPHMILTQDGPARKAYEDLDIPVTICNIPMVWEAPSPPWWHPNKLKNWMGFKSSKKLAKTIRKINPDLIHLNDTCSLSAGLTAKKLGIPVVCHVRAVHRTNTLCSRMLLQQIYETADILIPISEEYALQFAEKEKLKVVYNSLDFKKINKSAGQGYKFRQEFNIGDNVVLIGMVGTLTTHKGAGDFILAASQTIRHLPVNAPDVKFIIIGTIPEDRWFNKLGVRSEAYKAQKLIARHRISDNLLITGHRNDIYNVMDALDVVVFPTRLDATGRPVFEGNALGKPVISTVPTKETNVLLDGDTGFITPPGDPELLAEAMIKLLLDEKLRLSMGRKGAHHALKLFRPEKNIEPIYAIYKKLVEKNEFDRK